MGNLMPLPEQLAAPEWIDSGAAIVGGLDLLGLRLPVQYIGARFLMALRRSHRLRTRYLACLDCRDKGPRILSRPSLRLHRHKLRSRDRISMCAAGDEVIGVQAHRFVA